MSSSETGLAEAVRRYARLREGDPTAEPWPAGQNAPTPTEVAIAACAMLEAAGIELFELGLWRAWGGAPPAPEGGP